MSHEATSHWAFLRCFERYPEIRGRRGPKEVQLTTQYFPDPPVTGAIPEATACPLPLEIPL
jgi:hypothetical protein